MLRTKNTKRYLYARKIKLFIPVVAKKKRTYGSIGKKEAIEHVEYRIFFIIYMQMRRRIFFFKYCVVLRLLRTFFNYSTVHWLLLSETM